ncbi:Sua5/YciO/YrdC/YwlC family protein [Planctomicrobium sp. SH661]|uniref:arsenate reductase/protein-tyrosine-phosphatase family protein n=1 Tax=Planctomicrobium sp. SH661 TaxID=3448124 RepID=UPI003F5C19E1
MSIRGFRPWSIRFNHPSAILDHLPLMAREIFLDQLANAHEAVQAVVAELEAGQVVCLPDECGWNLLGLTTRDSALQAFAAGKENHRHRQAVSIAHPSVVADLVTSPSRLFQKLTARCWPGPVVLRTPDGKQGGNGLVAQWSAPAQAWGVTPQGRAFYCPADSFSQEVLRAVSSPAVSLLGATGETIAQPGLPDPSLIVHSSISRFQVPPTIVAVDQSKFTLERSGVVSERMLRRLAGEVYLFVCTGNTCRSPMAEAIFRKMLADHLHCREDELMDHGFVVISAGLAAYKGAPAAPESVELLYPDGIDLSAHESQPVTEELLFHCDHILTMTRSHRDAVLSSYPELSGQVRLLSPRSEDVPDPIGAGIEEYRRCREMITKCLQHLLAEIEAKGMEGNGA